MRMICVVALAICFCAIFSSVSAAQGVIPVPGKIEVENYSSFYDTTPGNSSGGCRTDDVDLDYPTWDEPDLETNCFLRSTVPGEWLGFTILVSQTDTYVLSVRLKPYSEDLPGGGGYYHVEVDGVNVSGPMHVPATEDAWWTTVHKHGIALTAGQHTLKLKMDSLGPASGRVGKFNYLALTKSAPFGGTPTTVPGIVEAENFDVNPYGGTGETFAYHDTGPTNAGDANYRPGEGVDIWTNAYDPGYQVNFSTKSEWMGYTVNAVETGVYQIGARLAYPYQAGTIHFEIDGVNVSGTVQVPNTGSWDIFQTVWTRKFFMATGLHTLYVVAEGTAPDGSVGQMDNFTFVDPPAPTAQVSRFGYYDIQNALHNYDYVNGVSGHANIAVIRPDETKYNLNGDRHYGAEFGSAHLDVIVQLGISQERLDHPNGTDFQNYLTDVFNDLYNGNMWNKVIAIAPDEEWNDRIIAEGSPEYNWTMFNGLTPGNGHDDCGSGTDGTNCWKTMRRNVWRDKMTTLIDVMKTKLHDLAQQHQAQPTDPLVVLVDTFWNDDYSKSADTRHAAGAESYHPAPANVDILGIDAYMGYKPTNEPYNVQCGLDMRDEFSDDVKTKYDLALGQYLQPILSVGQAFVSTGWPMISNCQMNWWYSQAQNDSLWGLIWFSFGLDGSQGSDNAVGVKNYPDSLHAQWWWLWDMYDRNQCVANGCGDMLLPGQSFAVGQGITSIDQRFRFTLESNGDLVIYEPGGERKRWPTAPTAAYALMGTDGNFAVYDGSGNAVWTAPVTHAQPGVYLIMQADGNLVMYTPDSPNESVWDTITCCSYRSGSPF